MTLKDLIPGNFYKVEDWIIEWKEGGDGKWLNSKEKRYGITSGFGSYNREYIKATDEEEHWLKACMAANNSFIPKDVALRLFKRVLPIFN